MGSPGTVTTWFNDIASEAAASGSTPNPDALPNAVASQSVGHSAGDLATNLSTGAGATWDDPYLGYKVIRLTDSSFPTSVNSTQGFSLDYSNMKGLVSQVWQSTAGVDHVSVSVIRVGAAGNWGDYLGRYILDVNLDTGAVANRGTVGTDGDVVWAFSHSTATKRHAYYISGGDLYRIDTATMTTDHTGDFAHFPVSGTTGLTFGAWLHVSQNDERIKWEQSFNNTHTRVVHDVASQTNVVQSSTASPVAYGGSGWNEGYLTEDGDYEVLWNSNSAHRLGKIGSTADLGVVKQLGSTANAVMVHPAIAFDWISWVEDGDQRHYLAKRTTGGWTGTRYTSTGTPLINLPGPDNVPSTHDNDSWVIRNSNQWKASGPDSAGGGGPGAVIDGSGMMHWHGVLIKPSSSTPPVVKTLCYYDGNSSSAPDGYWRNMFINMGLDGRTFAWCTPLNTAASPHVVLGIMPVST